MSNTVEEIMTEIAKAFYREIGKAASGTIAVKMVVDYAELQANSYDANGQQTTFVTKAHFSPLFERLREAMYKATPDHGAWYVAQLTVDANGKFGYDFDYEDTSHFRHPLTAVELERDLQHFPRTGKR